MSKLLAVIGGSGLYKLSGLEIVERRFVRTPFGNPSAPLVCGQMQGVEVAFLPRHGVSHSIPPHRVNYRANIWALKEIGADAIVAVNAVGAIADAIVPGSLIVPDQIVDYTWGREHTYFDGDGSGVRHVDFTQPFCSDLRKRLLDAAPDGLDLVPAAVYGATQGPRFESKAEVDRMERDGVDIVGMTGMPECGLARELELCYAMLAIAVNPAAGRGSGDIDMADIEGFLKQGTADVRRLLGSLLENF